jgi:lipopolysaccharide biosynthesis glycosyltransferase
MSSIKQAAVTIVYGQVTEELDQTFLTFSRNPFLQLHAFVIGDKLPSKQFPQIIYHLRPPDSSFSHPMRDADFRRWIFIDEIEVDYALVVDGKDVLCLGDLPELPTLLRGAAVGGCVEHNGGRPIIGQQYTSNYINGGVTLWNVRDSYEMRQEILARGKSRFRNTADDQVALNEVINTRYYDQLCILPCQYNYRAYLNRQQRGWPTVTHLDGVKIYHNYTCLEEARKLISIKNKAELPSLKPDSGPLTAAQQKWRQLRYRIAPLNLD